jgi:26S proteasome regulatory subunit N5
VQEGDSSNLDVVIESLLNVKKQMRLAGEVAGTRKSVIDIVELCYRAGVWKTLNDQIVLLSKRRGQLKQVRLHENFASPFSYYMSIRPFCCVV